MASRVIPVDPFDLVIFGGTGDLARRKILPALYRRFTAGQFASDTRLIGAARAEMDATAYRAFARDALTERRVVGMSEGRGSVRARKGALRGVHPPNKGRGAFFLHD